MFDALCGQHELPEPNESAVPALTIATVQTGILEALILLVKSSKHNQRNTDVPEYDRRECLTLLLCHDISAEILDCLGTEESGRELTTEPEIIFSA